MNLTRDACHEPDQEMNLRRDACHESDQEMNFNRDARHASDQEMNFTLLSIDYYFRGNAAVQLRTTVSGAAELYTELSDSARVTRKRCPSAELAKGRYWTI